MKLSLYSVNETVSDKANQHHQGFSLLELMIALMVLMILTIGTVHVVKNEREYDHLLENEKYIKNVKEAFITFVKVNHFLPCPDTDGDGRENRAGAPNFECTLARGRIPFLDLGVAATDVWQQPLFYAVNTRSDSSGLLDIADPDASASYFNNQTAPVFGFNTLPMALNGGAGNYRICGETTPVATGCTATTANAFLLESFAIAVVVSFGQNGAATWNEINGGASANLDAAEAENMDGNQRFWVAEGSQREGRAFDDQLVWLLDSEVKYAVISSGGTL